ncbi:MAG: hypothetical protein HY720_19905 [Planctomycetes bacterium]|nr:hypothetical protein [Planctomycetota bacterium]
MRTVLLTTETTHHAYFAREVGRRFPLAGILVETRAARAPFETAHPYERERDEYEREVLLAGLAGGLSYLAPSRSFETANEARAVEWLVSLRPDVAIVFGTGRLEAAATSAPGIACLNLHGGDPERYRGLDTHLWAIYHGEFDALVTTLHHVDPGLDTGDVVFRTGLVLGPGTRLAEFRAINTRACVDLALLALAGLDAGIALPRMRQARRGRYYSFMPAALKNRVATNFERHVARLGSRSPGSPA